MCCILRCLYSMPTLGAAVPGSVRPPGRGEFPVPAARRERPARPRGCPAAAPPARPAGSAPRGAAERGRAGPGAVRDRDAFVKGPFSAGSSGGSCSASCRLGSGRAGELRQETMNGRAFAQQRARGPAAGQARDTHRPGRSQRPQAFVPLDCEGIKTQESLLRNTLLELLFHDLVTTSRLN